MIITPDKLLFTVIISPNENGTVVPYFGFRNQFQKRYFPVKSFVKLEATNNYQSCWIESPIASESFLLTLFICLCSTFLPLPLLPTFYPLWTIYTYIYKRSIVLSYLSRFLSCLSLLSRQLSLPSILSSATLKLIG